MPPEFAHAEAGRGGGLGAPWGGGRSQHRQLLFSMHACAVVVLQDPFLVEHDQPASRVMHIRTNICMGCALLMAYCHEATITYVKGKPLFRQAASKCRKVFWQRMILVLKMTISENLTRKQSLSSSGLMLSDAMLPKMLQASHCCKKVYMSWACQHASSNITVGQLHVDLRQHASMEAAMTMQSQDRLLLIHQLCLAVQSCMLCGL